MATVYSATLTNATSATSGSLSVGSYSQLWIALNVTAIDWSGAAQVTVSRLDAFGTLFEILAFSPSEGQSSIDIGIGATNNLSFGDHVQVDITTIDATHISATVSVIGK